MKFQKGNRRKAIDYEPDLVQYWKANRTFEKSVEQRPASNAYVFYDGPPFITGVPHAGTLLASIIKDAIPRYWTMQGKRVERVWGWDCHGLPAEVFTEKKLGIADRRDIGTKITLKDYITTCRANMVQTGNLWDDTIDRIGRWVDMNRAYKTMDKEYMESVWWAFKTLYDKGKIYEGEKVLLYCTRDATPISKAEVAMDNSYQDVTDPSVFVKFKLKDDPAFVLAWTTTPWTLPANTAVAVNQKETYVRVEVAGEQFIMAEARLAHVLTDEKHQPVPFTLIGTLKGGELVGLEYEPLFGQLDALPDGHQDVLADSQAGRQPLADQAHKIWHADYVTMDDGTGIVHLAPAYGEEDYALSRQNGFPFVSNIDDSGFYTSGEWKGQYVWDANKPIAKELHSRGIIWKITYFQHSYPHCHRCGTKLMYRAHPSWFMDIDGQRSEMIATNQPINWFPAHLKQGRFLKTVESAPDWNLSRDRFWATAMPVWKGQSANGQELIKVVGSYAELKELSGVELDDYHRPWIDDVTFTIDGVVYERIDKVMDCWFESGSMPFAQFHYPFENVQKFEANFPGDFIVEYVGQVRAWFYYLHAISVGLFGKNAFTNVITTGTLAGNDGRKMSKSFGNYTDPNLLMDQYSADALRLLLLSSPLLNGEDFSLQDKDVGDIARKLSMVWNMYDFFTLYAEVDGWEFEPPVGPAVVDPSESLVNPLDQWIVSRIHQLNAEVSSSVEAYDIPNAVKPLLPFIDDASNWYVRRSRRRFWKSEGDADKQAAYRTLHYVLTQLALIMAPFTPFLAEELYRKLTGRESVHLEAWPSAGAVNVQIIDDMAQIRAAIVQGLAQRAAAGVKVRQPLASVTLAGLGVESGELLDIVKEELNVKTVILNDGAKAVGLDLNISPTLKAEGLAREVIRHVQTARKTAGLNVEDKIVLSLATEAVELAVAVKAHSDVILAETLAEGFEEGLVPLYTAAVVVDGFAMEVSLRRV